VPSALRCNSQRRAPRECTPAYARALTLAADTKEVSAVAHSSVERRDGICGEVVQRVEAGRGPAARGGGAHAPLAVPEEGASDDEETSD